MDPFEQFEEESKRSPPYAPRALHLLAECTSELSGIPRGEMRISVTKTGELKIKIADDFKFTMTLTPRGYLVDSICGIEMQHAAGINDMIMFLLLEGYGKKYALAHRVDELEQRVASLEAENEHLRYRPGGPGYEEAAQRFAAAASQLTGELQIE